jgi:UDP:flavonoid glycosyltransferase YjiC (YdhE family)
MGHQELPPEFGTLPANFHLAAYLPGPAMAARCDLMVHHGGHSSVISGLSAGTPAVIIPTATERESNARRMASLGAAQVVMPIPEPDGSKRIDVEEFRAAVNRVLSDNRFRSAAQGVAQSMKKYGGASQAADRIEKFTQSRIPR